MASASVLRLAALLLDPKALWAAATWPRFSLTSYQMVSALVQQGMMPRTVIDVGANVGQFAVAVARLMPRAQVQAFEPVPASVAGLRRSTARLERVTVHAMALGEAEAELAMHINSHSHSSSFLALAEGHRQAFPEADEVSTAQVPVRPLDALADGLDLAGPVLLKLDVQGFEPQVLAGAVETLARVDWVILEASFRPMYEGERLFTDMVELMQGYGFDFLRPVGWLHDPHSGEVLQMDALFGRREQAAGAAGGVGDEEAIGDA